MKRNQSALILTLFFVLAFSGCLPSTRQKNIQPQEPQPSPRKSDIRFEWPHAKRAAISLTFDDARYTQIDNALPILYTYAVKATFYVTPNNVQKRLQPWRRAAATGHEIGNHTLRHPCSANFKFAREKALEDYTLGLMRKQIDAANITIEELFGVTPKTFAYPCGQKFVGRGRNVKSYVPLVASRFLVGRGYLDETTNDPSYCDLAQVMGTRLDGLSFDQAKELADKAAAENRWIIFVSHEVADTSAPYVTSSDTLRALCEYATDPNNKLWIDTVEAIGTYIAEHHRIQKQKE